MKWTTQYDKQHGKVLKYKDWVLYRYFGASPNEWWRVYNEGHPHNTFGHGFTPEAALSDWAKNNRENAMRLLELVDDALHALTLEEKEK